MCDHMLLYGMLALFDDRLRLTKWERLHLLDFDLQFSNEACGIPPCNTNCTSPSLSHKLGLLQEQLPVRALLLQPN